MVGVDRRKSIVPSETGGGQHRHFRTDGWNCHSTVVTPLSPRPVASPVATTVAAAAMSPGVSWIDRRPRGEDARPGLAASRMALQSKSRPSSLTATSAISRSLVPESKRRASPAMVALRSAWASASCGLVPHPCRQPAGHQGDQEQDDNRDDIVGAVDVERKVRRGEKEIVGERRGGPHSWYRPEAQRAGNRPPEQIREDRQPNCPSAERSQAKPASRPPPASSASA